MSLEISEEEFYDEYKPQINHIARSNVSNLTADEDVAPWGGTMYETFGEELEYIQSLIKEEKGKHVWTIIECEDDFVISAGYYIVNRMGYIVTEKPWVEQYSQVVENF